MSDFAAHGGPGVPTGPRRVDAPQPEAPKAQTAGADSAEFQALLEKLEQRAEELRRASADGLGASELPGAVDRARVSLEDALSLGEGLLEAYRQRVQQGPGVAGEGEPRNTS